jgi:peroxiredoxin
MRLSPRASPLGSLLATALPLCAALAWGGEILRPGDPAPQFSFTDIQTGETRRMDEVAEGLPLLLVFLQPVCGTCVRERVGLKKALGSSPECRVLGVFVDIQPRWLQEYVALYDLPFTFTWDRDSSKADAYGVLCCPTGFLLDPTGGSLRCSTRGSPWRTVESMRADWGRLRARR